MYKVKNIHNIIDRIVYLDSSDVEGRPVYEFISLVNLKGLKVVFSFQRKPFMARQIHEETWEYAIDRLKDEAEDTILDRDNDLTAKDSDELDPDSDELEPDSDKLSSAIFGYKTYKILYKHYHYGGSAGYDINSSDRDGSLRYIVVRDQHDQVYRIIERMQNKKYIIAFFSRSYLYGKTNR